MISIGDTVKVRIHLGDKTSRISECIITNVYEKRGFVLYSKREERYIYKCSNLTEKRFLYETE